nr:retrovirus-related Pol polyprotein from transposon TNT 1-94 [Tanacetum cinerariifolium]
MSDSNTILCDQYVKDNEVPVIHSDLSYVPNDTFMMIYNDMCGPSAPSVSNTSRNAAVKTSLTAELATYRELVELYERRAKFELTEREQKINKQLRLVISDCNFKEETLKRELHSIKLQLASTINRNKSMVEETTFLKQDFKQKENKYLADFLNMKSLKEKVEDKLVKQDQSLQTVHILYELRIDDKLHFVEELVEIMDREIKQLKRKIPTTLRQDRTVVKSRVLSLEDKAHLTGETITSKKMNAKMTNPECVTHKVKIAPHDYSKENLLATFTPQKQLTPEQIYWSNDLMKLKSEALKERAKEFNKTCKKRIAPTTITDGERGFEQTKACYLQEVIPFFKTIKDNFEGIQKALTKEVKEMKDVFEKLEAEVFSVVTKSKLNVARFAKMHVANTSTEARCLALEAELATLCDKSHQENQGELIKHFSKLEVDHLNLQLKYQNLKDSIRNNPPTPDKDILDFDSVFVIGKMQASLQGKDNAIRQLKKQLSQLQVTRSNTDHVEPIVPRLRNNRDAHLDYLRHLKESVETIRDIVEEAKVVRPLDRSIVFACRYTKYSQELLEYAIGTCPQGSQPRAKQLAYIPLIRKKQVTVAKPSDKSDSNTHRHVVTVKFQKTNIPVPPSTGVNNCPNASGSQPKSHVKENRILPAKGDNKLPVDDQPRKNKSHLRTSNRIDSSSRLKRTVINSRSDSICQTCNKCLTPFNHDLCVVTCLQSAMATPSIRYNSSVERKVKQVWKPKQVEQVWKPIGKVLTTIGHQWRPTGRILHLRKQCPLTRVYYVEGLGHNLFFVGQLCDSDLEVAFENTLVMFMTQMNGVVERWNRTLVEAAQTMLIFSKALMFLWAEAVATACYTQNRYLIHTRHHKTPYELMHDKKPDLTFFTVFGALCYPTNDSQDLGKLQPTADTGIFVGYAPSRKGYRIYNKRT